MLPRVHFLLILLLKNKKKHFILFVISTLLMMLLASTLFIISSLRQDINAGLDAQADITLQKYQAGRLMNTPRSWLDEALNIDGVTNAQGRIYGTHFYEPKEEHFLIVGVDLYDKQIVHNLHKLLRDLNITEFLARKNMLIGSGVKEFFDKYQYNDYYIFRPPDRSKEKVYIYKTLPQTTALLSSDVILMDINEARKILGIPKDEFSDIILEVPNKNEIRTVYEKLLISHFNSRIITKENIKKYYANIFNYKGGIFIGLYILTLVTFLLIIYQRYSMIRTIDAKEAAILKSVGWNIKEIIYFKLLENFILLFFAYIFAILGALVYVYVLNAPILRDIFLGYSNLHTNVHFSPAVHIQDLVLLFLLFVIPFMLAIIVPLWKVATTEPHEVLK